MLFKKILIIITLISCEAKPIFLWKKLQKFGGLYGQRPVTPFPIILINFNVTSPFTNQSIIFLNTTPSPFVTLIDPRFQIGFRQQQSIKQNQSVQNLPPDLESDQSIPETNEYFDNSPTFPTVRTYPTSLKARSISNEGGATERQLQVSCSSSMPACPSNGYYKTAGGSNSRGFLANGCPCTDFKKINNILQKIAAEKSK